MSYSLFSMVNFEMVNGEESYYLGLSACRDDLKGQGLGRDLYQQFLSDCRQKETAEGKKFILWWTTATPIVYYWFNKNIHNVQPDMNGDYDVAGALIADNIRGEKFSSFAADPLHPFILCNVAANTNYSVREQERLATITEELKMDVFRKYDLNEENADRFLMFGYASKS